MSYDPVTQAELDYIPWAIEQGRSVAEIAQHLDRAESTIYRLRQDMGLAGKQRCPPRQRAYQPPPEPIARQLIELVPRIGARATAQQLGLGRKYVRGHAKHLGVRSPYPPNEERRRRV